MKKRITTVAGLQTAPNLIEAPLGSFKELNNCIVRTPNLIESRRGQNRLAYTLGATTTGPAVPPIIDEHTVAEWLLDEAAGSAIDAVTGAYTIPVFGTPPGAATGLIGGARSFGGNGSGQTFLYVGAPIAVKTILSAGSWTIEGWWNRNGTTEDGNIFVFLVPGQGALGFYDTAHPGKWGVYGIGTSLSSTTNMLANGWQHLCLRYNKATSVVDLFHNGVIEHHQTAVTFTAFNAGASINVAFGRYADAINIDLAAGLGDSWRLSDVARTDAEIAESVDRGHGIFHIDGPIKETTFFDASVLLHVDDRLVRDTGSSFDVYSGEYLAPAETELRMKFARAQERLYFTTTLGVKRLEAVTGTSPFAAGIPAPQIDSNSTRLVGIAAGFMPQNAAVAYRTTLIHRDAARREMESAPSSRVVVRSLSDLNAPAGSVVIVSNVLTITFDTVHSLKPGDIIDQEGIALIGFPFPLTPTVATVPTSFSITAALVNADATSGADVTFDMGGTNAVSVRRVDLHIIIPDEALAGDILRVWRTVTTAQARFDPGDECYLAYEKTLTTTDISNGYLNFADYTPDAMLGEPAYFAPSQETIAASNERPPLARDVASFDGKLWYANVQQRHQIDFAVMATGGAQGIALADTLTIAMGTNSLVLTAVNDVTATAGTGKYLLYTGGDVAGDNEKTALSLIAAINAHATNTFVDAFYLSDESTNPGSILLQERGVGSTLPLSLLVSAHGLGFVPQMPTSIARTSRSSIYPHRIYRSKREQPDAVPVLKGFEVVGEADDAILRIVPCGGLLWVFKERSTWNIAPNGDDTYSVTEFSADLRLVGNDTPSVMGRSIYCLSNLGPIALSGGGVTPLGTPIDYDISALFGYDSLNFPMLPALRRYAFGIPYASDRQWILALPTFPTDTYATALYVWNARTEVWTKWPLSRACGVVEPVSDLLYLASTDLTTPTLYKERKQFRRDDYKDDGVAITIDVITANADGTVTFHFNGATYPSVGSLLEQPGIYSPNKKKGVVKSIDTGAGTFTIYPGPLLSGDSWATAAATAYRPIAVSIRWLDEFCDNPGVMKALQGVNVHLQEGAFFKATLSLSTELAASATVKEIAGPDTYNVTTYSGGGSAHDDFSPPTLEQQRACYYLFALALEEAETYFKLAGITLDFSVATERTGRR